MQRVSTILFVSCGVFYCLMSGPARSQTTSSEPATGKDTEGLEEIVVTAQRREQSAQSVPIAITQYSADQLSTLGVTSTYDLPLMIPGFSIVPTGPTLSYFLRGVGNNQEFPTSENEIATYVDGVYMPFESGNLQNFNNIESVEIDKGPQGTLLGRNATGGAIQINTKDPSHISSADVKIGYGNYDTYDASFYGTTGITQNLAADLAVILHDQTEGWGTDLANGEPIYRNYNLGARTKWLYQASDETTIRFAGDFSEERSSLGTTLRPLAGQATQYNEVTGAPFSIPGSFNIDADTLPHYNVKQGGGSLKVNSNFDWAQGVSISSFRQNTEDLVFDYDATPIYFLNIPIHTNDKAFTQEFQLLSSSESSVTWATGVFYLNRIGSNEPSGFAGPGANIIFGAPPGGQFNVEGTESNRSYAVYGQATKEVLPATRLTLGARYTIDDIAVHGATFAGPTEVPGSYGSNSVQYKQPTYRFSIDHDLATDVLAYVSYNRGYHAGSYNLNSAAGFSEAANPPVKPETLNAYEAGIKSEWLDRRLRVNGSAFWYNYSNLQQQEYTVDGGVTVNAAAAQIRGIDLDISARPIERLNLSAAFEYLDGKYTSYPAAVFYTQIPNGPLVSAPGNAEGNQLPNAPRKSGNVNASYTFQTNIGSFVAGAGASYTGLEHGDAGNDVKLPAYWVFNLSETWHSPTDRYEVALWSKNIANRIYDVAVNPVTPVGYVGVPGAPRTFGISFETKL